MPLDRTTPVFFDATCLIAAVGSSTGGSAYLLLQCQRGFLAGAVSYPVLREAGRNIRVKLPPLALARFNRLRTRTALRLIRVTSRAQQPYTHLVNTKDVHVLTGAMLAAALFLVTLDRPLIQEVNGARLPIQALTPGEFIETILPQHPEYSSIRQ